MKPIDSTAEACAWAIDALRRHPERDAETAARLAYAGEKRPYPAFYLAHWVRVDDDTRDPEPDFILPEVADFGPDEDVAVAREAVGMLAPLGMLNPVALAFRLGVGPGTLAVAFGSRLDPACDNAVRGALTLEEALALPEPDAATSGLMPQIHERIRFLDERLPPEFLIRPPDVQGPFNLAHAVLGENVFFAPYDDPDGFREFMARVTRHWVAVQRQVGDWLGDRRKSLFAGGEVPYLAECSVNLVSTAFYEEFILPHDLAGVEAFGAVHVHPCSGPHVFKATWKHLPHIRVIEAGAMEHRMAAGAITVDEALDLIGDRPVLLAIGQELPEGREFETIARDFDRYSANRRLTFAYTGAHWLKKDRPAIRALHRRLDAYFASLP